MTTRTQKSEITATAIYRITVRETGRECYAVPSDSEPGAYYLACYDEQLPGWTCTCKSGQVQAARHQSANCKHARAAQLSIVVNKARRTEEARQRLYAELDARQPQFEQELAAVKSLGAMAQALGQAANANYLATVGTKPTRHMDAQETSDYFMSLAKKEDERKAPKREAKGTLNGSSQGFSLLK